MLVDWWVVEVVGIVGLGFGEERLGVGVVEGKDLGFGRLEDVVD